MEKKISRLQDELDATRQIGKKVCMARSDFQFSNAIVVPQSWGVDNCAAFASKIGGPTYFLGCMFENNIEFGSPAPSGGAGGQAAGKPDKNCGW
jgi:hypothetical protein